MDPLLEERSGDDRGVSDSHWRYALAHEGRVLVPRSEGGGPEQVDFASAVAQDSQMMEQAGINVVRTYGPILDTAVLDALYARGIYVLMTVYYVQ